MKKTSIYKLISDSAFEVVANHKRIPSLYPYETAMAELTGLRRATYFSHGKNNEAYRSIESAVKQLLAAQGGV